MSQDQHYQTHVFVCVNERAPDHPRSCCSARGSVELRAYMKDRAKELNIPDIRVNNAGCLERCELGPNLVIYPEGIWYQFQTRDDVDAWKNKLEAHGLTVNGPFIQGPEGGGLANGSGSYAIFFTDPNGVCFEINTGAMTVAEYRETKAETADHLANA